jgi:hypothetical protein
LRFYFPYLSLLAQLVNILVYYILRFYFPYLSLLAHMFCLKWTSRCISNLRLCYDAILLWEILLKNKSTIDIKTERTLRFYFPYLSLLAQPVNILVYYTLPFYFPYLSLLAQPVNIALFWKTNQRLILKQRDIVTRYSFII